MSISTVKAPYLTTEAFVRSLSHIWKPPQWRPLSKGSQHNIGLAVSGGVDSMALVALCADIQRRSLRVHHQLLEFKAFVVDHGVRDGSNAEAVKVTEAVRALGIDAEVLKMQWPPNCDPKSASNFETVARGLRYRLLGIACRENDIQSLFLGHHSDDQYETVMMRLATNHRRYGLRGVRRVGNVPACEELYGVNESGQEVIQDHDQSLWDPSTTSQEFDPRSLRMLSATGGVRIYRPFIAFTKEKLRKTCTQLGVPHFEDATNMDRTLTMRNAVRYVVANHQLPKALQKPSILALAQYFRENDGFINAEVEKYFKILDIQRFFPGCGYLRVDFGTIPTSIPFWQTIAKRLMERVMGLVSSEASLGLDIARSAQLFKIFPESYSSQDPAASLPASFSIGSVWFIPLTIEYSMLQPQPIRSKNIWLLARQPPPMIERPRLDLIFPGTGLDSGVAFSQWHFFDGRYWIRIQNQTPLAVRLRLCREEDIATANRLVREATRSTKGWLNTARWKELVPQAVRMVLPLLTVTEDGRERLVAFPTLNLLLAEEYRDVVKWQIRYKHVDIGGRKDLGPFITVTESSSTTGQPQWADFLEDRRLIPRRSKERRVTRRTTKADQEARKR